MEILGRFAPSPSGRMHLGNLFCALLAWLSARRKGGRVLLRIEDLDTARCRPAYSRQVQADLLWLGLAWDVGPGRDGGTGPYLQSERTAVYQAALAKLQGMGLVYPCFCTRADLHAASAPHRQDGRGVYPGTCRRLTAADIAQKRRRRAPALRLAVPDERLDFTDGHMGRYGENLAADCGDFLLRRSDGLFAYQLAVVVDDAAMGVTEVVRGADLLDSTPRQLYLYRLLGLTPPAFYHFPLLVNARGRRLSKRDGDLGLETLQARMTPREVLGRLAYLGGFNPSAAPRGPEELLADFAWEKVPRRDIAVPPGLF